MKRKPGPPPSQDRMAARHLVPGDVIEYGDDLAVVVSNEYPATTVPYPESERYCEPGLTILKHFSNDQWVRTHHFTYCLLLINEQIVTYNAIRVQQHDGFGPFESEQERKRTHDADDPTTAN